MDEELQKAIDGCLSDINNPQVNEEVTSIKVQELEALSRIQNEKLKTEADIKRGADEVRVKKMDFFGRLGLGCVSVFGSLGVMGMIKEIELEGGTVSTRAFSLALNGIQKIFRL